MEFVRGLPEERSTRVRVTGPERLGCLHCTRDCPMGIDVLHDHVLAGHATVNDPECTRCGSCTDRCLGDILQLGFAWPETASKVTPGTRAPEHSSSRQKASR